MIASTKTAAEAVGLADAVGTLENGKLADCVVLSQNPLEDIKCLLVKENINMVFKDGKLV